MRLRRLEMLSGISHQCFPDQPRCYHDQNTRKENPQTFVRDHSQSTLTEKSSSDRRNFDRPPWEEESLIAQRGQERDAEAAVGEHIKDRVTERHGREVRSDLPPRKLNAGKEKEGNDNT